MSSLHLSIPTPCHENWQQMTPKDRGRHCSSCEKIVVDFTHMSDQQLLDYMRQATTSVCGRFNNHQLNKRYSDVKEKRSFSFAYGWSVVIGALLLSGQPVSAQSGELILGIVVPNNIPADKPFWSISKAIHKPSLREMALAYAKVQPPVMEEPELTGVIITRAEYVVGDTMIVEEPGIPETCPIGVVREAAILATSGQAIVPDTTAVAVDTGLLVVRDIMLEEEVPDRVMGACEEGTWKGEVAVVVEESQLDLAKRTIADWLPVDKAIKVYPNPVAGGGTVNVSVSIRQPGSYKLELLDASGRQVHVQALQVVQSPQVLTINTQSSWSHGVYWMRITGKQQKDVYQSKLVIQ